jgi:hypothetical protein
MMGKTKLREIREALALAAAGVGGVNPPAIVSTAEELESLSPFARIAEERRV